MAGYLHKYTGQPVILLVEGKRDGNFLYRLMEYLNLKDTIYLLDRELEPGQQPELGVGGNEEFGKVIKAIRANPHFRSGEIRIVAIVRDADKDANVAFAETQNDFRGNGLPIPEQATQISPPNAQGTKTAIYIMPDAKSVGYIEDLFIRALTEYPIDELMNCLQKDLIDCLHDANYDVPATKVSKMMYNMFLVGRRADLPTTSADWYVHERGLLPLDSDAFKGIRDFLKLLAEAANIA